MEKILLDYIQGTGPGCGTLLQLIAGDLKVACYLGLGEEEADSLSRQLPSQFSEWLHGAFDWILEQKNALPLSSGTPKMAFKKVVRPAAVRCELFAAEDFPTLGGGGEDDNVMLDGGGNQPTFANAATGTAIVTKRIKPTTIGQEAARLKPPADDSPFKSANNRATAAEVTKPSSDFFREERELLKSLKASDAPKVSVKCDEIKTPKQKTKEVKRPERAMVTRSDEIDRVKNLYVSLFCANRLANNGEELRWLFEVLAKPSTKLKSTVIVAEDDDYLKINIFATLHNCYHFAHLVFRALLIDRGLARLLSATAISYIVDCVLPSMTTFDPLNNDLEARLMSIVTQSTSSSPRQLRDFLRGAPTGGGTAVDQEMFVPFQPDTDSKGHFPHQASFVAFRKQRDEFYRLLAIYTNMRWAEMIGGDTKVQREMQTRIQTLLERCKDVANYQHLARLFVDQMLCSCHEESATSVDQQQPKQPKQSDKLKRLEDRLVARKSSSPSAAASPLGDGVSSLVPEGYFNSKEKFFADFVYFADSDSFNRQLKLVVASKIRFLTTAELEGGEMGEALAASAQELRAAFLVRTSRLSLLARLLGFVCFYPNETKIAATGSESGTFLQEQLELRAMAREQSEPPLDLVSYLVNSLDAHGLVVAVPWVVDFLACLDPISLASEAYEPVLGILLTIFRYYLPSLSLVYEERCQGSDLNIPATCLLLQLYLERLFNSGKFQPKLAELDAKLSPGEGYLVSEKIKANLMLATEGFDFKWDLIEPEVLGNLMPAYSIKIVQLFKTITAASSVSGGGEIRKIKPTALPRAPGEIGKLPGTETLKIATSFTAMKLPVAEVEESFFNLHSISLRGCVFFTIDRASSIALKRLKANFYPVEKNTIFRKIREVNSKTNKRLTPEEIIQVADQLRRGCRLYVTKEIIALVDTVLSKLIGDHDTPTDVIARATEICTRRAEIKSFDWIAANIGDQLVSSEYDGWIQQEMRPKMAAEVELDKGEEGEDKLESNRLLCSLYERFTDVVLRLRDLTYELNLRSSPVKVEDIERVLEGLDQLLPRRWRLANARIALLEVSMLDLAISLVAFQPKAATDKVIDKFVDLWSSNCIKYTRLVSPKHLHKLSLAPEASTAWLRFEILARRMLAAKIYEFGDLEKDTFVIVKQDWPEAMLARFASCLQALVDFAKDRRLIKVGEDDGHELLEWIAWFTFDRSEGLEV